MIAAILSSILVVIIFSHFSIAPVTLFQLLIVGMAQMMIGLQLEQLWELKEINGK